ncbi:MAG: PTS fructose transporter subunit IIA [Gammaproteobacteria bacterium]|jgi:mannose PTS system EIIA component|nr:PTS fructose transporter subunit IIA [Gammaproteobacteria bacterium]
MSVSILIVSHGQLAEQLIQIATSTFGGVAPLQCKSLSVSQTCDPDLVAAANTDMIVKLDQGDGVLIFTDAYGSTPSNIANRLAAIGTSKVIAGVNLPMLLRVFNYPEQSLNELSTIAFNGGQDGIIICS